MVPAVADAAATALRAPSAFDGEMEMNKRLQKSAKKKPRGL